MSVAAFVGYSLIAVGPQVVIILSCIVGKPFLVLLGLARLVEQRFSVTVKD